MVSKRAEGSRPLETLRSAESLLDAPDVESQKHDKPSASGFNEHLDQHELSADTMPPAELDSGPVDDRYEGMHKPDRLDGTRDDDVASARKWFREGLMPLTLVLLSVCLGLMALIAWLLWSLKHVASRIQPTIRMEVAEGARLARTNTFVPPNGFGTPPSRESAGKSMSTSDGSPPTERVAVADFGADDIPVQLFGPSFADEKRADRERQQDLQECIFREIRDDNLALQTHLVRSHAY